MKRYVKRGGTFEQVDKIVTVRDTIQGADGKDSIVFRDLIVPCPTPIIKTKWMYRFDNRRFKDSVKHIRKTIQDSLDHVETIKSDSIDGVVKNAKTAAKVTKNENNNNTKQIKAKWNVWIILTSLVMGWLLPKIAQRAWKKWK
jgi:hypothetical protein